MTGVRAARALNSRTPFWSRHGPYASLRICVTLVAAQAVLLFPLAFLSGAAMMVGDLGVLAVDALGVLWAGIPLGAIYGICLGVWDGASEDPILARAAGVLCNTAYLLLWSMALVLIIQ